MKKIICPNCGEQFTIDESGYADIVKQVRDDEFEREIREREALMIKEKNTAIQLEVSKLTAQKDKEISELNNKIKLAEIQKDGLIKEAIQEKENDINSLKNVVNSLKNDIDLEKKQSELEKKNLCEKYRDELKMKDDLISQYKDFKLRQSTKMIGESLEQYCSNEFNKIRSIAYPNAYFAKDNLVSKTGSKGDFIFRDTRDGAEIVSIMFEMKNEADDTLSKHKNEDFLKELDKDRKEKNCEYAVLVSMLEPENDLYNSGIVDVSYKYEKMYVIRPQFFLPLISILYNTAMNSLEYKKQLIEVKNQNIDITNFENAMNAFKDDFSSNVAKAGDKFKKAIDEIDKSIEHLNKIKENLLASDHNLQIANGKAEKLTIKKLTKGNKTMTEMFEKLDAEKNASLESA